MCVHTVVWAIIDMASYRELTEINFKNYSNFLLLIYLALHSLDRQKSQTLRLPIYGM